MPEHMKNTSSDDAKNPQVDDTSYAGEHAEASVADAAPQMIEQPTGMPEEFIAGQSAASCPLPPEHISLERPVSSTPPAAGGKSTGPAPKSAPKNPNAKMHYSPKPSPSAPAPGVAAKPRQVPERMMTPNLAGPDAAIAQHWNVVKEDLEDPSLQKETDAHQRKRVRIYIIVSAVAIIIAVLLLVFVISPMVGASL